VFFIISYFFFRKLRISEKGEHGQVLERSSSG
jgi:hypothetical protein